MVRLGIAVLVFSACGRIGFEPTDDIVPDGPAPIGHHAAYVTPTGALRHLYRAPAGTWQRTYDSGAVVGPQVALIADRRRVFAVARSAPQTLVVRELAAASASLSIEVATDVAAKSRDFDLAFETASGHALLAYTSGGGLWFRTWNGESWSEEAQVPLTAGGAPIWVALYPHPTTDEISLLTSTSTSALVSWVWSGSAWTATTPEILEPMLYELSYPDFDAAYEQLSGGFVAAWGKAGDDPYVRYRDPAGLTYSTQRKFLLGVDSGAMAVAAKPGDNLVAVAALETGFGTANDIVTAVWDSTALLGNERVAANSHDFDPVLGARPVEVFWHGAEARVLFSDAGVRMSRWQGASWTASTLVAAIPCFALATAANPSNGSVSVIGVEESGALVAFDLDIGAVTIPADQAVIDGRPIAVALVR